MSLPLSLFFSLLLIILGLHVSLSVITANTTKDFYDLQDEDEGHSPLYEDSDPKEIWKEEDKLFLNDEGDHVYYDRAIIEKKNFRRKNPHVPLSRIRSLRRFLSNPKN